MARHGISGATTRLLPAPSRGSDCRDDLVDRSKVYDAMIDGLVHNRGLFLALGMRSEVDRCTGLINHARAVRL